MANEEDNNEEVSSEEDSGEDGSETGTPLLDDDAHDSYASAPRDTDRARATYTADVKEDTQIKEVDNLLMVMILKMMLGKMIMI